MKNFNSEGECITHTGFIMVIGLLILAEVLVPFGLLIVLLAGAIALIAIPAIILIVIGRWIYVWKTGGIKKGMPIVNEP